MKPKEIDKIRAAFTANIADLMPTNEPGYADYRKNWTHRKTWGFQLFNQWFYSGLTKLELKPKEGIDQKAALSHIRAIMGSW